VFVSCKIKSTVIYYESVLIRVPVLILKDDELASQLGLKISIISRSGKQFLL